ncbi:aspartyl-tRNA synthetase [Meinhardsimonia xiamenensis]|jgi:aspartyl-tRNA synthetase|uniref:Aspartate--tRNA(Asp/Asn) ligase n=1 Tax=Meinhardsimonia xiamenensis TaxID=990712 RepID=A0A1G9EJX7_9RHOB|nr:aspartate--tRNA ligase [Meinhardsimonia xiamenensis]PRX33734.1 aspartyl-tRNA synthetase [Meinhardsimonia xiamenensis]SDK76472.1 aspartyl-tRNA synthetase [Meinhardsimonia xiamenensis]
MHRYRSHTCAELTRAHVGQTVRLAGWVHRVRDHGGVLFIDLRDHYGITQILADADSPVFGEVEKVRAEWCIRIDGEVKARDDELINPKIPTGEIEVYIRDIEVLGPAAELPLQVFGDHEYPEETRLRYRYLDLRREGLKRNILLRSNVIRDLRERMWQAGFTEYQTPIITASSPEGARDFLVPSRLHRGKFYALPQAPQQFKQLIMVAGYDRYFQIAPCFRDEDPRADRSPTDFYQLDMEMSFVTQEDVFAAIQPVLQASFERFGGGRKVDSAWPRIRYADAMKWYGTDKPDLRCPIKMADVSEHFRGSGFAIFARLLEQEGTEIRAIPAQGGGSRAFCDRMNAFAQKEGLPGMGYIFWREKDGELEAAGPIARNIGPERTEAIRRQLGLGKGDAAFFLGGKPEAFERVAAKARVEIGRELGHFEEDRFAFAWIVDFPMYEKDPETGKIDFSHNPFSMPQGGLEALEGDPLEVIGQQYDLACNGYELVSGAIRNHDREIMFRAFEIAGYTREEVERRFPGLAAAFRYGPPPHGGCAVGIDRMVMLLADEINIREVIMFPMNQRAEDLMMGAPSEPTNEQLRELGIRIIREED